MEELLFSQGELQIIYDALISQEGKGWFTNDRVFRELKKRIVHALAMKIE